LEDRQAPEDVAAFCTREHPRLVGSLGLLTGDPKLAEELAQEALARACRDWERVGAMAAPGAWVHRVAMNLAASHYRRGRVARSVQRRLEAETPTAHRDADGGDAVAVRQAIGALDRRKASAVVLRFYLGYSHAEVAQVLGIRESTARSLIHRAKADLRVALALDDPLETTEVHHA
jgi:RNA polymerase sigma-70 factor (ECF subfamily)